MTDSAADTDGPDRQHGNDLAGLAPPGEGRNGDEPSLGARIWVNFLRVLAVLGAMLLLLTIFTGAAGVYTSRPQFCRSCHNMEPYYVSWQESSHHNVSCIKCHFPPGVAEEVRGKMLGLIQLAKYVTASAGPQPVAEVPDASCLRSGCHETRLLAGRVNFQGIPFDHQPHLGGPRRGMKLRCTSCHNQIVQGTHMTVSTTTCFLCHFKGEHFNEGFGTCTRCHQIPDKGFDLGGGVTFHHDLAYEKGVDCANCHGDLIRGSGAVPSERCGVCHNREDDLKKIHDRQFLHDKHVTEHKVDCLDCHLAIHHALDPNRIEEAAANCAACHPNHHSEQVRMLLGEGAKTVPVQTSRMTVARIACPTCHRVKETTPTGTVLWKASTAICIECHNREDAARLMAYHHQLQRALKEVSAVVARVAQRLPAAESDETKTARLQKRLDQVRADLAFLHAANGIHNMHYASTVTRELVKQSLDLAKELGIEAPEITLPEPPKLK